MHLQTEDQLPLTNVEHQLLATELSVHQAPEAVLLPELIAHLHHRQAEIAAVVIILPILHLTAPADLPLWVLQVPADHRHPVPEEVRAEVVIN